MKAKLFYVFFLCSLLFKLCIHYDHWRSMVWNRTIVSVQEYMFWLLTLQGGSVTPTIRYLNVGIPVLICKKLYVFVSPLGSMREIRTFRPFLDIYSRTKKITCPQCRCLFSGVIKEARMSSLGINIENADVSLNLVSWILQCHKLSSQTFS